MANLPAYASTVNVGAGLVPATADTSLTAPTNVTTIITAGSNGTKIEEIDMTGVGTTVAGLVNVFLYDGSTYHLWDQVPVSVVTASTTAASWTSQVTYANLILKTGWSVRVTNTVAGNASLIKVVAFGGDY